MEQEFLRILTKHGFESQPARRCAAIFAQTSLDGVYSHGVNRFARFVTYIKKGYVDVHASPTKVAGEAAIEQWDGRLGPGPLNASFCTDRAITLAEKYGMGCVALRNTNHWMRGGTYGWQAAKAGCVFIGWTNTLANMPAWGAVEPRLGNNPLVLAAPHKSEAIVLDMAMSQYSYGAVESHELKGRQLPLPGGYDKRGKLSKTPADILETERLLPMGYWKGAGLSLLLDLLATILSGGLATHEISKHDGEYGVSQVYIAFDIRKFDHYPAISRAIDGILADYLASIPADDLSEIVYPGQRVLRCRKENLATGIPVDKVVWDEILAL